MNSIKDEPADSRACCREHEIQGRAVYNQNVDDRKAGCEERHVTARRLQSESDVMAVLAARSRRGSAEWADPITDARWLLEYAERLRERIDVALSWIHRTESKMGGITIGQLMIEEALQGQVTTRG